MESGEDISLFNKARFVDIATQEKFIRGSRNVLLPKPKDISYNGR